MSHIIADETTNLHTADFALPVKGLGIDRTRLGADGFCTLEADGGCGCLRCIVTKFRPFRH